MRKIRPDLVYGRPWTPEEIAEACEATADLLEGHWTTGAWICRRLDPGNTTEFYCVEGALAAALGLDVEDMAEGSEERTLLLDCPVYNAVLETVEVPFVDLMHWNDMAVTSEQQVLDVLHATAKRVLGVPRDDA